MTRPDFLIAFFVALAAPSVLGAADWPQFRGPGGTAVADTAALPVTWSAKDNVAWVTELPGRGWSSPIVHGDRVFVTSAVNAGAFKAPSTGIFGNDYAAQLEKQGLPMEE